MIYDKYLISKQEYNFKNKEINDKFIGHTQETIW